MSASQTTTNCNLPVFEPNDVPAWLTDWNSAMGDIDTAIAGAKTAADTAQLTASRAANGVSTLNTAVGNLQTTVGNQESTITSLGNSLNTVQSLIGNGTPTTTDQTIIGAINEINAAYKDAANIEFDNDGTGMSATNVQAAIVEAYNHSGGGGGSTAAAVSYDNTDSGLTATNVQDAIDELASGAVVNVRWDSTTDRFQVLKNGNWVNSIRAFVNSIAVWASGVFGITVDNGVYSQSASFSTVKAFTTSGNNLVVPAMSATEAATLVSDDVINFTNYSKIKVITNLETKELNVSGISGNGYLYITVPYESSNTKILNIGVVVAKQNNLQDASNVIIRNVDDNLLTAGAFSYISEITVE